MILCSGQDCKFVTVQLIINLVVGHGKTYRCSYKGIQEKKILRDKLSTWKSYKVMQLGLRALVQWFHACLSQNSP